MFRLKSLFLRVRSLEEESVERGEDETESDETDNDTVSEEVTRRIDGTIYRYEMLSATVKTDVQSRRNK